MDAAPLDTESHLGAMDLSSSGLRPWKSRIGGRRNTGVRDNDVDVVDSASFELFDDLAGIRVGLVLDADEDQAGAVGHGGVLQLLVSRRGAVADASDDGMVRAEEVRFG